MTVLKQACLPTGWTLTTLGEAFRWGSGGTPKSDHRQYYGGDIPWVVIGDLNDGVISQSASTITEEGLANSTARWVEPDSVLVAMYGSIGKLGIAGRRLTTNQAIAFTNPAPIHPRYLFWYLASIRPQLQQRGKGGTQQNISQTVLRDVEFPLAPLAEQRRIVAVLEEHLSDLDAAVEGLERAHANTLRYRASVIAAAVRGQLISHSRVKWVGTPSGWTDVRLDKLATIVSGQTPKGVEDRASTIGTILWLKVGDMNLVGNERTITTARGWLSERDAQALRLHVRPAGTIIFPKRGGAIATNKKRVLARPATFDLNTMGLVPVEGVGPYLWWWFQTVDLATISDGSNVPQINHGDVASLRVPLPPLEEQHLIVNEIERRLAVVDLAVAEIEVQIIRARRLRQSLLKCAFAGKLVHQDPNDEPASIFLDRIRTQRGVASMHAARARRSSATSH